MAGGHIPDVMHAIVNQGDSLVPFMRGVFRVGSQCFGAAPAVRWKSV